jgi:hypothetical protein
LLFLTDPRQTKRVSPQFTGNRPKHLGRFVLPSAVPIILFALLLFVLLALGGVVLLSLALRTSSDLFVVAPKSYEFITRSVDAKERDKTRLLALNRKRYT